MTHRIPALVFLSVAGVAGTLSAMAGEYHASPRGRDTHEGTRSSPWSLARANVALRPGDTLVLADGAYTTQIAPARSGMAGRRITYRAANRHQARFADLSGKGEPAARAAVNLVDRAYITIDGIAARDVPRFVVGLRSHHITINGCHFANTRGPMGWENVRFRWAGDRIHLTNNLFKNGTDLVRIYGGDEHLIEGNVFDTASHACLALIGTQRSVVRGNTLRNPVIKLMELQTSYGERSTTRRPFARVVIEGNHFEYTASYRKKGSSSPGIFLAGKHVIIRRNLVTNCQVGAWFYTQGSKLEGRYCYGLRVYNNVFHANGRPGGYKNNGPAIRLTHARGARQWGDHVIANNIILANEHFPGRHIQGLPRTIQILFDRQTHPRDVRIFGNLILHRRADEPVIALANGAGGQSFTLQGYENAYARYAWGNIASDPQLVDAAGGNFRLRSGSPCLDAGQPLTAARSGGRGDAIEVEDATYFCDGFGIVDPDVIRVGSERVTIVRVDYDANRITVDRTIAWRAGAPVSPDYAGKAPDIGAFEFGLPSAGHQ